MKHLRTGEMSAQTRKMVKRLGTIRTIARGLVFALAGVLVIDAAITYQRVQGGRSGHVPAHPAQRAVRGVPADLAALGLIAFGIYGLAEARWRRV